MGAKQAIFAERAASYPEVGDWSRFVVGCRREDYSASLLARAVEDCDAHVLNLNVSEPGALTGDAAAGVTSDDGYAVRVELRVNHRNAECVSRSLERYGFAVLSAESSSEADDGRRLDNYRNLMHYLEI